MKKKKFPVKSALLLSASALLLIGSTVGSTRAALTYYSENYTAQMFMSNIGVTLLENDNPVSHRDYISDGNWDAQLNGVLLTNLLGEGESLVPGKKYTEELTVQNTGTIDTFNRVVLTKSWQNADGKKDTTLTPDMIDLNILEENGWVIAADQSTAERTVLYYTKVLPAGETAPDFSDTIRIDNKIAEKVTKIQEGQTIRYVYDYDGYTFTLEAEVDAVQTHNAKDAIKSAWGVDVNVSEDETSLSLQ